MTPLGSALRRCQRARAGRAPAAAYLGATNLAGYLAGALLARRIAASVPPATALRAMMALATLAFFACALPLSFSWFFLWRFAASLAGGTLMVLAAPTVPPQVPAARRGLAGGVIFTGVGLGITLALTALAWRAWPEAAPPAPPTPTAVQPPAPTRAAPPPARGQWILFGLGALAGPVLAGRLADRIGYRRALRLTSRPRRSRCPR